MFNLINNLSRRGSLAFGLGRGRSSKRVEIGDRYYKVGYGDAAFVVERRFNPGCESLPHVVLSRVDNERDKRVVSETILKDPSHYQLDRRIGQEQNSSKNRRESDAEQDDIPKIKAGEEGPEGNNSSNPKSAAVT